MNPLVDMVIPAAPKDYNKLPYVIDAARKHFKISTIHVIAPTSAPRDYIRFDNVVLHRDCEVLPYDRFELKYRPNWVFQQLLKVFQDVTEQDWFLVTDADIIANKAMPLWTSNGKPIFYLGRDQLHGPYFAFNELMLGFGKNHDWSFLSECVMYSKKLVREMLAFCNLTLDEFWKKTVEITCLGCKPADAELYGSYIMHAYPDLYEFRKVHAALGGRYKSHIWNEKEIKYEIDKATREGAHLTSIHSWEGG